MSSPDCQLIRHQFEELETLKAQFDQAYQEAVKTGKLESARELKRKIETTRLSLREKLDSRRWQEKFHQNYNSQHEIWTKLGVIEKLPTGHEVLVGIDGQTYPFPTFAEITKRLEAQRELIEQKAEQGFTRLLVVPFGAKLDDLIEKYRQTISSHYVSMLDPQDPTKRIADPAKTRLFATKKDPSEPDQPLTLDESQPLWVWDKYQNADISGDLKYYPKLFDANNHGGQAKTEILAENSEAGWSLLLIEDNPNIPREGKGETLGGRKRLEAGRTPAEYLAELDPTEAGLTPEDWLAQAITYLEETNQVIDDYDGHGSVNYNLGGWFPASGLVSLAYWRRDVRQAVLGGAVPDHRDGYYGARAGVRV